MNNKLTIIHEILKNNPSDYYTLQFNDDTALQNFSDFIVLEGNTIIFFDCIYFDSRDNGEECSTYELTSERAEDVITVTYRNPEGTSSTVYI